MWPPDKLSSLLEKEGDKSPDVGFVSFSIPSCFFFFVPSLSWRIPVHVFLVLGILIVVPTLTLPWTTLASLGEIHILSRNQVEIIHLDLKKAKKKKKTPVFKIYFRIGIFYLVCLLSISMFMRCWLFSDILRHLIFFHLLRSSFDIYFKTSYSKFASFERVFFLSFARKRNVFKKKYF